MHICPLDIPIFHQDNIVFVKPRKLVIHLIAHPPFPLLWQTMMLLTGLPWAKSNPIDVVHWHWNDCSCVIGSETKRFDDVRFGEAAPLVKRGGLIAKERGERRVFAEGGIQIASPLHRPLCNLIKVRTRSCDLEGDLALMQSLMTGFTQRQQI